MIIVWHTKAREDYLRWRETDETVFIAINELIQDIQRHPFRGLGKPSVLKSALRGYWVRRISENCRLVYRVSGKGKARQVDIAQCCY